MMRERLFVAMGSNGAPPCSRNRKQEPARIFELLDFFQRVLHVVADRGGRCPECPRDAHGLRSERDAASLVLLHTLWILLLLFTGLLQIYAIVKYGWPGLHFLLSGGDPPMPRHVARARGLSWDDGSLENLVLGGDATS